MYVLTDGFESADEENDNGFHLDSDDDETSAVYANAEEMTRSIQLADLAAYVDEKQCHGGFRAEHRVSYGSVFVTALQLTRI